MPAHSGRFVRRPRGNARRHFNNARRCDAGWPKTRLTFSFFAFTFNKAFAPANDPNWRKDYPARSRAFGQRLLFTFIIYVYSVRRYRLKISRLCPLLSLWDGASRGSRRGSDGLRRCAVSGLSRWTLLTLSDGLLTGVGFQPDGSHWAGPHGGPCGRPRRVNCGPGQVRSGQVNSGGRGHVL